MKAFDQPDPPRPLSPGQLARMEWLRRWSRMLDSAFRIPGTELRWGWDPILGLLPGIGDTLTPLFSCFLMLHAFNVGIPKLVQLRMLLNVAIDLVIGIIPVVGDLFDFAWKSNERNLALLERHTYVIRRPGVGDWIFVLAVLGSLAVCSLIPPLVLAWLLRALGRSWV